MLNISLVTFSGVVCAITARTERRHSRRAGRWGGGESGEGQGRRKFQ